MHTRAKGNRVRRLAITELEALGYLVEVVEKTGRFVKVKDLFGLWDLLAIRKGEFKPLLVQVKCRKPVLLRFTQFAAEYPGFHCAIWIWQGKRKGWRKIPL